MAKASQPETVAAVVVNYVPTAMTSAGSQFGFIGAAFVLLSWLFAASLVVVVAAVIGAMIGATRDPPDSITYSAMPPSGS